MVARLGDFRDEREASLRFRNLESPASSPRGRAVLPCLWRGLGRLGACCGDGEKRLWGCGEVVKLAVAKTFSSLQCFCTNYGNGMQLVVVSA